ncbi:MAG: hypothetical protein E6Q97_14110 [Desulfurellales bacterium]|nr:MAG: hypothetical protein E6Q97_14110 [Desulfurellales bacterium]
MSTPVYNRGQVHNFHSTCNYAQFSCVKKNRTIDQDHLMQLYDAVSAKNLLAEFPILVDTNLNVIDGQHRLKVAESLGVPIYYIVSDRITVDDISSTNANTRHWRPRDYMDRWLAEGRMEYIALDRFMKKFPFFTLPEASRLCYFGDFMGFSQRFNRGEYRCNDSAFATKVAHALMDFAKVFPNYHDRSFINAVANLVGNVNYDHKTMMARLEYQSTKLVRCADMRSYIELVNEIYNYRTQQSRRVTLRLLTAGEPDWRPDRKKQERDLRLAASDVATVPLFNQP